MADRSCPRNWIRRRLTLNRFFLGGLCRRIRYFQSLLRRRFSRRDPTFAPLCTTYGGGDGQVRTCAHKKTITKAFRREKESLPPPVSSSFLRPLRKLASGTRGEGDGISRRRKKGKDNRSIRNFIITARELHTFFLLLLTWWYKIGGRGRGRRPKGEEEVFFLPRPISSSSSSSPVLIP